MDTGRLARAWRRVFSLAWPVMAERTFRTAMRTTDVIVTAQFPPAAVVAIGLADLYARFPPRIGLGLELGLGGGGGGAVALSSQDTGATAAPNRDEAITQAVAMGLLLGVPFVVAGVLFGEEVIALLGADPGTARLGGRYLAVVFATVPARHVAPIGARSLQCTGDTRTPMYVNVVANGLTIADSVGLGPGVGPLPRLGVVGVGAATAAANVFTASVLPLALATWWADADLVRPRAPVIARQLVRVSTPRVLEGFAAAVAEFAFNGLLLAFGTPVNAGFRIGRRMYQQVTGPLSRGYNVAASVVVGQALGDGDPDRALPRVRRDRTRPRDRWRHRPRARSPRARVRPRVHRRERRGAVRGRVRTRVRRDRDVPGLVLRALWLAPGRERDPDPAARAGDRHVLFAGFRYTGWAARAAGVMAERGSGEGGAGADAPDARTGRSRGSRGVGSRRKKGGN